MNTAHAGVTNVRTIIAPLLVGNHVPWRCRDFMREKTGQRGPYQGHFAATLEYLPSDYTTDPHLTLTVGRRLTPFNMYSERFTTLWIRRVQDALIVYLSGTRASGSSNGTMVRGVVSGNGWNCKLRCIFPPFYRFRRICRLGGAAGEPVDRRSGTRN